MTEFQRTAPLLAYMKTSFPSRRRALLAWPFSAASQQAIEIIPGARARQSAPKWHPILLGTISGFESCCDSVKSSPGRESEKFV